MVFLQHPIYFYTQNSSIISSHHVFNIFTVTTMISYNKIELFYRFLNPLFRIQETAL